MAVVNSSRINLKEGLESAIMKYLDDYSEDVIQAAEQITASIAKDTVAKLKAESPQGKHGGQHKYAKGWTYKLDKMRLRVGATIYGKKGTYNLAHLLEFGHALRSGGRQVGSTAAIEHIRPVEQLAIKEYEKRLIRAIESRR